MEAPAALPLIAHPICRRTPGWRQCRVGPDESRRIFTTFVAFSMELLAWFKSRQHFLTCFELGMVQIRVTPPQFRIDCGGVLPYNIYRISYHILADCDPFINRTSNADINREGCIRWWFLSSISCNISSSGFSHLSHTCFHIEQHGDSESV